MVVVILVIVFACFDGPQGYTSWHMRAGNNIYFEVNICDAVRITKLSTLRYLPQRLEGRREVRKNILEQTKGPELRERRPEPLRAGDEVVGKVEPLQVRAVQTLERGDGVEVEVYFHEIDEGFEALQASQGVVGEGEDLNQFHNHREEIS